MPLAMDYVIDCKEQDAYEVKYKGEVIGKERYHGMAVSMVTGHIAGRCERAEKMLASIVESWTAYQATMDAVGPENKMHWVDFLAAMRAAQQTGEADVCRVCGGDGIQDSGVRGKRKCVACDGTGKP